MHRRRNPVAICVAGAWLAAIGVHGPEVRADMIDTAATQTWEHCALCHSADGNSRMAKFPKLAGQNGDYMLKQLTDFRNGQRANDGGMMHGAATQFPVTELAKAARYFSALPAPPPAAREDVALYERGRALFERGHAAASLPACTSCHGPSAASETARPRLEAQHARYLRKQLRDFQSGERANDANTIMRDIASRLGEAEIAALAAYLSQTERRAR